MLPPNLNLKELSEMIAELEVSSDGKVEKEDFVAIMNISSDMVSNSSMRRTNT